MQAPSIFCLDHCCSLGAISASTPGLVSHVSPTLNTRESGHFKSFHGLFLSSRLSSNSLAWVERSFQISPQAFPRASFLPSCPCSSHSQTSASCVRPPDLCNVVVPEPHTTEGTCYLPCLSCYCPRSPKSGRVSPCRAETGSLDPSTWHILAYGGICWIFMEWVETELQSSFCCPVHLLCGWQGVGQKMTGSRRERKYAHKTASAN